MENQKFTARLSIEDMSAEIWGRFQLYCFYKGSTVKDVLKKYIEDLVAEIDPEEIMHKVRRLMKERPDLIDLFLAERDPKYIDFDYEKKKQVQNILFYLKPVDIYNRYIEWEKDQ